MPTSRKDRRSQAWRTFIRNHAITITQSHSLNGDNLARDLLSHVRSRSSVFTYRLSATVVAPVTGSSSLAAWHTVHPFLVAVARSCILFTRIVTLITKFAALACRYPSAARKACLLDRIRDPPIARELKRTGDPLINALNWKGVSFARSTQRRITVSSTRITRFPNRNCCALDRRHRPASSSYIWNYVFEVPCNAAHVLMNDSQ